MIQFPSGYGIHRLRRFWQVRSDRCALRPASAFRRGPGLPALVHPPRFHLIDSRNQSPRPGAVVLIIGAEVRAQQPILSSLAVSAIARPGFVRGFAGGTCDVSINTVCSLICAVRANYEWSATQQPTAQALPQAGREMPFQRRHLSTKRYRERTKVAPAPRIQFLEI